MLAAEEATRMCFFRCSIDRVRLVGFVVCRHDCGGEENIRSRDCGTSHPAIAW